VIIALVYWWE